MPSLGENATLPEFGLTTAATQDAATRGLVDGWSLSTPRENSTPTDSDVRGDITTILSHVTDGVSATVISTISKSISNTISSTSNDTGINTDSSTLSDSYVSTITNTVGHTLSETLRKTVSGQLSDTFIDTLADTITDTVSKTITTHITFTAALQDNVTDFGYVTNNSSDGDNPEYEYALKHPAVGVMLALFSFTVIAGNVMVIVAVFKELYLRSVTNYFIVSLAIADVMVGGVVMPFSISHEMTNDVWLYGKEWCDLWHSLDVLASTASILNLCVISLDRYWAITDPINYPTKMSNSRVCLCITLVWLCSAGISFPAIAWWKAVTPSDLPAHECQFTEDSGYLIISSLISFYVPTFIMMFVYAKIYRAAAAQSEGIKAGSKITSNGLRGDDGEVMTLRIHRGGLRTQDDYHHHNHHHHHHHHSNGGGGESSCSGSGGGGGNQIQCERSTSDSEGDSPCHSTRVHALDSANSTPRPAKHITKRLRHFAISKKLTKLAREQKAAKTLGIVVGVFIICWLPFFVTNVLYGVCKLECVQNPKILFPVVTWLGYINSGMNPIIYALSMRDFRRAFGKMIFVCCPRYRFQQHHKRQYQHHNSMSTSSFTAACSDRCVALRI